ncbi:cytosolic-abundant heat soluble protein 89226-like [Paramacrobiotus metropolitanus]|uniref:cytosolic-abundant heat soluble protein 89226-like n=1 Tax=Paramacrobiotus metropolitanus TaxID=2943436 RepID=UPI00244568A9|nr:cytosolic-abundant heat soluble protein 89226-like [Paramacrobiotus metropolitanus]
MPLFGSKKDKKHKDDIVVDERDIAVERDRDSLGSRDVSRDHVSYGSHDLPTTDKHAQEFKYERVEEIHVDGNGNAELRDVRVDRGGEDPGMNFKDKRPPALVPGAPVGYVPEIHELDSVANQREGIQNYFADNTTVSQTQRASREPSLIQEKTVVREDTLRDRDGIPPINSTPASERYSQRSVSQTSDDTASVASSVSSMSSISRASERTTGTADRINIARQEAPALGREVNFVQQGIENLQNLPQLNREERYISERRSEIHSVPNIPPAVEMNRAPMYRQEADIIIPGERREVIEKTEILRSAAPARFQERIDVITVPVQRMETAQMEHVRSGVTYTNDKEIIIPGPMVAPPIPSVTHDLLAQGSGGTSAEIHASTNIDLLANTQLQGQSPEEYERYRARIEDLAREHEMDTAQKAAMYRSQVEADAELIRRTLERQHIRDIEFRKDMVESAVDRQQHEIQLEAEYAMRALEKEREAARQALEQAKMETHIDVKVDSAIGTTISKGEVQTAAGREIREAGLTPQSVYPATRI